ncbi:mitochondrial import receptor subunit [Raphidocelis subcapitata]|uniref:Mitochondrial import receptor subunit n=1 Tax=Raphidocelis subcapitata TaxID=307507 RepID=A0A2V0NUP9_9CHLO|nr:mitochondrial import receptor subunit [Raphidocelis subcapitata]|eukprot:GBF91368.1 mitochondrial import receptor subunit [Raphidocelis subcapitata]
MFGDDSERELFFVHAVAEAQRQFAADNTNADALVRWGGALLELAHQRQQDEAVQLIKESIEKLNQALTIEPGHTDANWCIGNAHTSLGFLQQSKDAAVEEFTKARAVFQACVDKDPANETYRKALQMSDQAHVYYDEIQQQLQEAQAASKRSGGGRGGGKLASGAGGSGGEPDPLGLSDWVWDAAGWVLLVAAIGGIALMARGGSAAPAKG